MSMAKPKSGTDHDSATSSAGRAKLPPGRAWLWFLLLLASFVGINVYAWVIFFLRALSMDLSGVFTATALLVANLLLLIAYWLATVLAVPHRMGPSVPLRHLVVRLSK